MFPVDHDFTPSSAILRLVLWSTARHLGPSRKAAGRNMKKLFDAKQEAFRNRVRLIDTDGFYKSHEEGSENRDDRYQCQLCDQRYRWRYDLNRHTRLYCDGSWEKPVRTSKIGQHVASYVLKTSLMSIAASLPSLEKYGNGSVNNQIGPKIIPGIEQYLSGSRVISGRRQAMWLSDEIRRLKNQGFRIQERESPIKNLRFRLPEVHARTDSEPPVARLAELPLQVPPSAYDISNDLTSGRFSHGTAYGALVSPFLSLIAAIMPETATVPGKARMKWQCHCGYSSYDDFVENSAGALLEMAASLKQFSETGSSRSKSRSSLATLKDFFGSLMIGSHVDRAQSQLPQHTREPTRVSHADPGTSTSPSQLLHVLLAFPCGSRGSRLSQPPIKDVRCDHAFFELLKVHYKSTRSLLKQIISLKTIRKIKFAQVEVYRSKLVDIRKIDDLPLPADREYIYDPKPPDLIPPVGENLMMHLFAHPHHADALDAVLLKRIPKKNNALTVCPVKGTGLGWGLHFIEGWHVGLLWFCFLFLVVLGSIIFLICWGILQHDVQGASGVAAYSLTLMTAIGGSLQAGIEMELF